MRTFSARLVHKLKQRESSGLGASLRVSEGQSFRPTVYHWPKDGPGVYYVVVAITFLVAEAKYLTEAT